MQLNWITSIFGLLNINTMLNIKHRTQLVGLLISLNLPLSAVEVGTAEGYNAEDLLKAGMQKLYLVDNWATIESQAGDGGFNQEWHDKNYEAAMLRIKPYGNKAIVLRGLSVDMAKEVPDGSLGLVYLDGDHSYEGVMRDLKAWFPKLVQNGVMAGHDYLNTAYGVRSAVMDFGAGAYEIHIIEENKEVDAGFYFIKK